MVCLNLEFGSGYCVLGFSVWFWLLLCWDLHVVFGFGYYCVFVSTDWFWLLLCVGDSVWFWLLLCVFILVFDSVYYCVLGLRVRF